MACCFVKRDTHHSLALQYNSAFGLKLPGNRDNLSLRLDDFLAANRAEQTRYPL